MLVIGYSPLERLFGFYSICGLDMLSYHALLFRLIVQQRARSLTVSRPKATSLGSTRACTRIF
jgi:hypothetical protein